MIILKMYKYGIIIITMCIGVVFYWATVIIDDFKK